MSNGDLTQYLHDVATRLHQLAYTGHSDKEEPLLEVANELRHRAESIKWEQQP